MQNTRPRNDDRASDSKNDGSGQRGGSVMPARLPFARFETHESGYERWRSYEDGRERYVYVHRLLAVAEYGFDAVVDMDVHHKNGVHWCNWGENVEPQAPTRHSSYHYRERGMGDVS